MTSFDSLALVVRDVPAAAALVPVAPAQRLTH
jgi:hypothetical protein